MSSVEVNWGRGRAALLAPQLGEHLGEYPIGMVAKQRAHRENRLPTAAVQFETTVRPVRGAGKGGRAAGRLKQIANNRIPDDSGSSSRLFLIGGLATFSTMYVVTEADAAAIREVYERDGELSAAIELRRRFPGITDNTKAREQARAIVGWKPRPPRPAPIRRPRKGKAHPG
jgi:hypothetical protein